MLSPRVTRELGSFATTGTWQADRNSLRANDLRKEFGFVSQNGISPRVHSIFLEPAHRQPPGPVLPSPNCQRSRYDAHNQEACALFKGTRRGASKTSASEQDRPDTPCRPRPMETQVMPLIGSRLGFVRRNGLSAIPLMAGSSQDLRRPRKLASFAPAAISLSQTKVPGSFKVHERSALAFFRRIAFSLPVVASSVVRTAHAVGSCQWAVPVGLTEGPDTGSRRLGHSHRILQDPGAAGCPIESIRHKCLKEPLPKKKSDVPRSVRPSRGASAHARRGRQRRRQCPGGARCRVSRGWPWTRDPGK